MEGHLDRISDWTIALSYFAIPIEMLVFARMFGIHQRAAKVVLTLFVLFITLCGMTHAANAMCLTRANHVLKLLTAMISFLTSLALIKVIPLVFAMPAKLENMGMDNEYESNMRIFNQTIVMCTRNLREPQLVELAAQTLKYMFPAYRTAVVERGVQTHHGLCETIINSKYAILVDPDLHRHNRRFFEDLAKQISQQQMEIV